MNDSMQELTPGNTQTFTEARARVTNTRMILRGKGVKLSEGGEVKSFPFAPINRFYTVSDKGGGGRKEK